MNTTDLDITKPPIRQKYVFLTAFLLTVIMILQSNIEVDGIWQINLNRVLIFAYNYLTWAIAVPFLYKLFRPFDFQNIWRQKLIQWISLALIISLVQVVLTNVLYYATLIPFFETAINNPVDHFMNFFPQAYLSRLIDFMVIFFLLKALDNYRTVNIQKVAVADLERQLTQSRLETLKMQLNPHFLFNALHAIHSLIGYDNDKSKKLLLQISQLLRKILELSDQQMIALEEELELFKTYLAIEEERFHDRLTVVYNIDNQAKDTLVPSLLLQPLLENALKHGISLIEGKGEINLKIELSENHLNITLGNTYDPNTSALDSTGIGLKNVQKRLETLFPDKFNMTTDSNSNWFEVIISIPRHDI